MGTRGIIARPTPGDGFEGRYHHWDSYPTGLGATLFRLANEHFSGDLKRMMAVLIDEHPAGWSTITHANWNNPPGFTENPPSYFREDNTYDEKRAFAESHPSCYCHGDRKEEPKPLLTQVGDDGGAEYAYVISIEGRTMGVLEKRYDDDDSRAVGFFGCSQIDAHWRILAIIPLDGPEPDWDNLLAVAASRSI